MKIKALGLGLLVWVILSFSVRSDLALWAGCFITSAYAGLHAVQFLVDLGKIGKGVALGVCGIIVAAPATFILTLYLL